MSNAGLNKYGLAALEATQSNCSKRQKNITVRCLCRVIYTPRIVQNAVLGIIDAIDLQVRNMA